VGRFIGFFPELIWVLGETNCEARFWIRSQSVNFSNGSEGFLVLTWSIKWEMICRWSESIMLETVISDAQKYRARQYLPQESSEWDNVVLKFQTHYYTFAHIYFLLNFNLICSHSSSSLHASAVYGLHQVLFFLLKCRTLCQNYLQRVNAVCICRPYEPSACLILHL
jgi:hypothetical protein